jgi:hypothetical protein
MTELRFEWDRKKAAENTRKHGVSLEEAESVFADEFAILLDDPNHSIEEGIRLFEGSPQPVRGAVEASGDHPSGRAHDQVLQVVVSRVGNPIPDADQPLPAELRGYTEAALVGLEVGCLNQRGTTTGLY